VKTTSEMSRKREGRHEERSTVRKKTYLDKSVEINGFGLQVLEEETVERGH